MLEKFLSKLTRITSSGKYIGEIDGLRFLAICLVVFYHLNGFILANSKLHYIDSYSNYKWLNDFFEKGNVGVPLFFAISGFVLAVPFANEYITKTSKVFLKDYYLRRLTRLEPPYILVLFAMFLGELFIMHHQTAEVLIKSLLASLFYISNILYPETLPIINCVTWSLEVEIQFYIIAPLIALIFKLKIIPRRAVLIVLTIVFPVLQYYVPCPINCIYLHAEFFLIGFLLADLYVSPIKLNFPIIPSIILGAICLIGFIDLTYVRISDTLLLLTCIFIFYSMVLSFGNIWNLIFKQRVLCVIGGMCYSIYLLHFGIISFFGKPLLRIRFTNYYITDLIIQFIVLTTFVLLISSFFFFFFEKTFMRKDWYKQIKK